MIVSVLNLLHDLLRVIGCPKWTFRSPNSWNLIIVINADQNEQLTQYFEPFGYNHKNLDKHAYSTYDLYGSCYYLQYLNLQGQ